MYKARTKGVFRLETKNTRYKSYKHEHGRGEGEVTPLENLKKVNFLRNNGREAAGFFSFLPPPPPPSGKNLCPCMLQVHCCHFPSFKSFILLTFLINLNLLKRDSRAYCYYYCCHDRYIHFQWGTNQRG